MRGIIRSVGHVAVTIDCHVYSDAL